MDCAAMRSEVSGDFHEPYGAVLGVNIRLMTAGFGGCPLSIVLAAYRTPALAGILRGGLNYKFY